MAAQSKTLLKGALHLAVMANVIPQRPPSPRERRAAAGVDGGLRGRVDSDARTVGGLG
jgi:hypothetical protein